MTESSDSQFQTPLILESRPNLWPQFLSRKLVAPLGLRSGIQGALGFPSFPSLLALLGDTGIGRETLRCILSLGDLIGPPKPDQGFFLI